MPGARKSAVVCTGIPSCSRVSWDAGALLRRSLVDFLLLGSPYQGMSLIRSSRNFRLLFSATAISNLGDGVSALAFPWLATLITRDPALIALVAFASKLPWMLFSIPAGILADRHDRRRLMVQADALRLLLTAGVVAVILSLPGLPATGAETVYILLLSTFAFALGAAEVVRDNAAQTFLPAIVDKKDLETANGQLWSVEHVAGSFVGPPLAGFLIAWSVPAPFVLDAVTFGLAAWLVWCIRVPPRPKPPAAKVWPQIRESWTWLRSNVVLLRLALMLGLINAFNMMLITLLVLVSQERLGLDATGHGILLTAGAFGGVLGGLIGPHVIARLGGQVSLWLALALMAVPFAVLGWTSNPWIAGAALFLEMVVALLWNIVTVSYRQRMIPDDMLGRVNALYRFFGWGMMPFGALIGGWIVAALEPQIGRDLALRIPFFIGAFGSVVLFVYGLRRLRIDA